jgi:hypothetical protein
MFPLCLAAALLLPATQISPATNRKITGQNYCPPCQLGKLPSSRISTDILALRAQNLQQLSATLIKSHRPQNTIVPRKSLLTAKHRPQHPFVPPPIEWCAHPPLPVSYPSLPTHTFTSQPPSVPHPSS